MLKILISSLILISIFAVTPIRAIEHDEEAITLFNPVVVEMKF